MASPIMISVLADDGRQFLINLQFVEVVEFPSPVAGLQDNLNVESVLMEGGEVIRLPLGTWQAALDALYSEFDENPQPRENVKGELYIMPEI